ncbi:Peroxisomal membrane PEX29 [Lecanosticta acicola]|uniref:Peroxisomal membrane PEX29 n=1 Tax=Lecanosticta acicola TaxID=111012 RepID=A0AAI9ED40_9PEZI|nr:Peroxisomal membrane PEX29 [Lecanosticta acicola]
MNNEAADPAGAAMANRDEAIPVIRMPFIEDAETPACSGSEEQVEEAEGKAGKRDKLREQASRIKDKLDTYGSPDGRQSLQDRVFSSIITQIIGSDAPAEGDEAGGPLPRKKDRRSKKYVDRPEFGPRLMTYNFRRFNARIGVVFVLQNRLIHLFTWRRPTATLSFLAVYSLLCLKPHLLPLAPLVLILFGIMIPSFLARHPTPANDPRIEPSYRGPPTAPASRVKPAPDLSTDFWRNMRDLQNSMEDFSRLHDAANEYITPYTNFSDEAFSSTLFLLLCVLSCTAFIGSRLVPWRFIALSGGWTATLAGHPRAQKLLMSSRNLSQFRQQVDHMQTALRNFVENDALMDDPPELRQVEIFELQKHHPESDTWESWLFSPSPYDPLNSQRMSGARPKGTQFFEDVQAPAGWVWKEKKWNLDLFSREWVEQRIITGVEIETEGERWVYDIPREEVDELLESPTRNKKKRVRSIPKSGWEEGTGLGQRGEWRRRRWTRLVEKHSSTAASTADKAPG